MGGTGATDNVDGIPEASRVLGSFIVGMVDGISVWSMLVLKSSAPDFDSRNDLPGDGASRVGDAPNGEYCSSVFKALGPGSRREGIIS